MEELKGKYGLNVLLKHLNLNKRSYYYSLSHENYKKEKDQPLLEEIIKSYKKNYKKYGSPRITIDLQSKGIKVCKNHVARIMRENHISAAPRKKKYNSYKGEVGVIAHNILNRHFDHGEPFKAFGTDVTQFNIGEDKLYLSPIMDFHTREIVAYDISIHPNMLQIKRMMYQLEDKYGDYLPGSIIHSDQGWQYQQKWYQDFLQDHEMIQSMSRKGNCLDNSPTDNFFGRLKEEVFYGHEWRYENVEQLREAIHKWIKYYNEERIAVALKNSPLKYKSELLLHRV